MQQINLDEIVKVQTKGLLTIPKKLRLKIGLEEKDLVKIREEKGRLVIEPLRTLPYPVRSYTEEELKEFLELDRKETKNLKKKGLL